MIHELAVFNLFSASREMGFPDHLNRAPWIDWSTCVRQMRIGLSDWLQENSEAPKGLTGREAYSYLLEVICGLHSPMIGETEVFGQFRERVLNFNEHPQLTKIFKSLIVDAKTIRQLHLENLGANSYGSLTRKYTRDFDGLAILGAGKLATEILPWLKQKEIVEVFARTPEKVRFQSFPNVTLETLDKTSLSRALVVAAPVTDEWLSSWIKIHFPYLSLLIDLRENSRSDAFSRNNFSTVVLQDYFSEINANQDQIRQRIESAKKEIDNLSEQRLKTQEIRPFGWDDICA